MVLVVRALFFCVMRGKRADCVADTPSYVIYHELILTSKEYMTQVTAVDPYWLAELGSVFYSVREKNFDERGNRRQADREFSRRAELETEMARQREECVLFPLLIQLAALLTGVS